jgi:hypothetical protein
MVDRLRMLRIRVTKYYRCKVAEIVRLRMRGASEHNPEDLEGEYDDGDTLNE